MGIEWCDLTINPVAGCSKCSPGCENCYAEKFAARLAKNPNPKIAAKYLGIVDAQGKWTGRIRLDRSFFFSKKTAHPDRKSASKSHKMIFVGSMCDLFNLDAYARFDREYNQGYGWRNNCDSAKYVFWNLFNYFAKNPQSTFILLTKRPVEAAMIFDDTLNSWASRIGEQVPLPNVWLGVTVCNQQEAAVKLPILMKIPAAKRFVSVEPMLEPVDLGKWLPDTYECGSCGTRVARHERPDISCENCGFCGEDTEDVWGDGPSRVCPKCHGEDTGPVCPDCGSDMLVEGLTTISLDWVICGAETGRGARPMDLQWAMDLRDQCRAARIPFFFKRAGNNMPIPDDLMVREFPEG